jgi:peptide chain release factor subunit 3
MPLQDKYKDMGTVVMGKIESGTVRRGDNLLVMPNKIPVKVVAIFRDADEVQAAKPGENLRIRLSGVEEEDITPGYVVCGPSESFETNRIEPGFYRANVDNLPGCLGG